MADIGPGRVIYRERMTYPPWLWAVIVLPFAVFLAVFIGGLLKYSTMKQVHFATWISGMLLALVISLIYYFRTLDFVITQTTIEFGFSLLRKRFDRADLEMCEPYELTFRKFGGYGIRRGTDGTIAYNTRNGPGIKMNFTGFPRPYVVTVKDPEKVCELLGGPADAT